MGSGQAGRVRAERSQLRQANLPSMGVAGQHQVDVRVHGRGEDTRGVRQQEAKVFRGRACQRKVNPVQSPVRVIDATDDESFIAPF